MIEYPSIINSSKAPRQHCFAFDKIDGSNIRIKWTRKNSFELFGSRTELIDESHKFLGEAIPIFKERYASQLHDFYSSEKEFRNQREIITFAEFFGPQSFAGLHIEDDPKDLYIFNVLVGHKDRYFIKPKDFLKTIATLVNTPKLIYEGNFNDSFIEDVRVGKYDVNEGVIAKGTQTNGAFRGKMWQAKIKTYSYFERLKARFAENWEKYGE